jgi:hypothetical protein
MRTSSEKTTAAVLRKILGIRTSEGMAKILKQSVHTIRSVESGRLELSHELATRMFHETGISIAWLMKKDPTVPPIAETGEPYTREIYERTQALKTAYDQPHPMLLNFDKLGFCARLIAILESASARKDYFLARYKVHTALDSLRREFGMDEKVYRHSDPYYVSDAYNVHTTMAIAALKEVLARQEEIESFFKQSHHPTPKPTKKRASKKRRR